MKHIKKFNESNQPIQKADKQSIIDGILDNLSDKGELSKSEKEFMIAASNDEVKDVTIPKTTGNFVVDSGNPHNLGTMWVGKNGVWKQLLSLEDEDHEDEQEDEENDDKKWEQDKKRKQLKYIQKIPGLKNLLNDLAIIHYNHEKSVHDVKKELKFLMKKLSSDERYQLDNKMDYALKTLESLFNQFGYIIDSVEYDEDDEFGYKLTKK